MATAGSAGSAAPPGRPASAAGRDRPADRPGSRSGAGCSPREDEGRRCAEPGAPPACPLCRSSGSEERVRRRSEAERSSSRPGRRDGDSRREVFVCPAVVLKSADTKHKLLCEDDLRRKNFHICKDESASVRHDEDPGVVSDSENEEPISRRIRNVSAFVRKTKNSSAASGAQRSRSCTDPVEDGGKMKTFPQPAAIMDRVGMGHSSSAGILLSSENSRSVSAPVAADRRLPWRAVMTSWSTPLGPERSISPESNDSISEELNHFKPIVCSPCTPPKRLPDGRLLEPTIVKSTPRNLTRGLQKATSYEASPAVLQKWRQIELDRQSLKVNSKATLTSPVPETQDAAKMQPSAAGDTVSSANKRKLLFDPPPGDSDTFQKQSVKIRVPAIRYSEAPFRGGADFEASGAPEPCGGALFSRKRSFSPYTKNSGFQSCKLVPKDSQGPRKESEHQSTSRRGPKRNQKTKHVDSDRDQDPRRGQIQQDRALALKLQRQFDLENQTGRRRSPDKYFLRSWMSNQNRRRRGLRRSRRINTKH
ncbi:E3 ubiquitin-protein ligase RNF169 [Scomber scombrus]|uniref:E3 ubiquitin-protein ligase RNF169 n=1 Tax=Scomber scombrus TaxID=13677 RepID=UPI002DDBD071|nr:E3 ubiquitin-protein ligase RNF169 [Scomber scombrus]